MTALAPDAPRQFPGRGGFRRRARKGLTNLQKGFANLRFVQFSMIFGLITYADYFNLTGYSTAGVGALGKYAYFVCLAFALVNATVHSERIQLGWNAPTIFLGFTAFALVPFLYQLATVGDTNSYATAFVGSVAFSVAAFYGSNWDKRDAEPTRKKLAHWLLALSVLYVGELFVRKYGDFVYFLHVLNITNHLKSNVFVIALALALLAGRTRMVFWLFVLVGVSTFLRPSTSLILALSICLPVIWLIRRRLLFWAEVAAVFVIASAAAIPLALQLVPGLSEIAVSSETFIKADTLGGTSNTLTRLAIMDVAFKRIEESSWLVGEMFTGGTSVQVADVLPFWRSNFSSGLAQIHTDYVCVLMEGGVIGYLLFNIAIFLFSRSCFEFLRGEHAIAERAIVGAGIVGVLSLAIYASGNPLLQAYQATIAIWLIMFCAQVIVMKDWIVRGLGPRG